MAGKKRLDIEQILRWAYVHELPKRLPDDGTRSFGDDLFMLGGGGGGGGYVSTIPDAVMYGAPHHDALMLDYAVRGLEPARLTLPMAKQLLGDLAVWLTREVFRAVETTIIKRKKREVAGIVVREEILHETGFDARELSPAKLVPIHARLGNRPNWVTGAPRIARVLGSNNKPIVRGITKGRRYAEGAHSPLQLVPSIDIILRARFEYAVWWMALCELAERCRMTEHFALPPSAPPFPWLSAAENSAEVSRRVGKTYNSFT